MKKRDKEWDEEPVIGPYTTPIDPKFRKQQIGCRLPCSQTPTKVCPGVENCELCKGLKDD